MSMERRIVTAVSHLSLRVFVAHCFCSRGWEWLQLFRRTLKSMTDQATRCTFQSMEARHPSLKTHRNGKEKSGGLLRISMDLWMSLVQLPGVRAIASTEVLHIENAVDSTSCSAPQMSSGHNHLFWRMPRWPQLRRLHEIYEAASTSPRSIIHPNNLLCKFM